VGLILDSSLLIADERERLDLSHWLRARPPEPIAISAITLSGLWFGIEVETDAARARRRRRWLEKTFRRLEIVPLDTAGARVHARLWAHRRIDPCTSAATCASQRMNYADAIQFLYGLRLFGAKFGLENTFKLAALSGNPQNQLRFIHVAGTNGKGSTCAMLESIYRRAGLRVALYTSPHLVAFGERIQVNRQPIAEADVVRLVQEIQPWLKEFPADHHPTFFEVATVMALRYFAEQKCDLVLWETGLGGRLDSTNIVTPLASVLTNIQFDHQRWLGETLDQIAAEKAGIIKPGVPIITGAEEPQALAVIQETAQHQRSPLTLVTPAHTQHPPLDTLKLPLLGWHQRMNAAVALATVRALQAQIPVSEDDLREGLATVRWPGRLQLVERQRGSGTGCQPVSPSPKSECSAPEAGRMPVLLPSQRVLLDGAHNAAGATSLRAALEEHFPKTQPAFILGIMADKDWDLMCEILAPLAGRILCVPVHSERSAAPDQLREACRRTNPGVEAKTCASLAEALNRAALEPFLVVAGSLYLIGEAMELLHIAAAPVTDEKRLNEWTSVAVKS
jgi:dihydrofolate synthase/folylpolyglutamate synthase